MHVAELALVGAELDAIKQDFGELEARVFPFGVEVQGFARFALHLEQHRAAFEFAAVRQDVRDGVAIHPKERIPSLHARVGGGRAGFHPGDQGWVNNVRQGDHQRFSVAHAGRDVGLRVLGRGFSRTTRVAVGDQPRLPFHMSPFLPNLHRCEPSRL